ncbi:T9SS type A sorting domain-containing protein [Membranicola marinus]|uniref:T9SS type A sorting domain-containing protein n=1 Tax=Membranihabitans marinus TaxID=1227546 RepID=A0A953HR99_9BACT|nr:T9SS type A sorting domain-containing protein [Membranihabitans marinus]MBY5959809.1 T9SS type A sorting domain-containing protein [Membranihabitans marinus]
MNIYPNIHQEKTRRLLYLLCSFVLFLVVVPKSQGQQILKDVIVGDDVACPGLTNTYRIGLDLYFPMNIQWRIIEGPGEFVGSDRGESVEVQWKTTDRGYTKLVMFAVSYYPPLGLIDTVTINVDKDLNRLNLNCFQDLVLDFGMDCERYIDINEVITNGKVKCLDDFEFTLELENLTIPNPVPKRYNGRTFKATITHKETGQFCRSDITLGDFSGPRLICKNDTVLCSDPRAYDPKNNLFGQPEVIADCNENYTLKVNEYKWVNVDNDPFIEGYIERVWRAVDQNGNKTDCTDTVFLQKIIFDEIACPADAEITCDSLELLNQPLRTGTPTFMGQSIYSEDPYCKVYLTYEDEEVPGCGGSKTIFRTWLISSYENEGVREKSCTQIINVVDTTGPEIQFKTGTYEMEQHDNIEGAEPGILYPTFYRNAITDNCRAEGDFPIPNLIKECSTPEELLVTIKWGDQELMFDMNDPDADIRFRNMTIGNYLVEYSAYDACGNVGKDTIVLKLFDKKPPTLVLDDDPGVVLTNQQSLVWSDVSAFDEGSFDNCELEILLARRVDWKTACGYTADTSVSSEVRNYYDEFANKIAFQEDSCLTRLVDYGWTDKIPFCCEDVCTEGVLVEFLAIDAFCNYSKLVTRVKVTDQSPPVVKYKLPNISMNCYTYQSKYKAEIEKGNTSVFGQYVTSEAERQNHAIEVYECSEGRSTPYVESTVDFMDGYVMDNCNVTIEETFDENIGICGEGYVERIFTISNPCSDTPEESESIQVIQKIFITKDCRLRPEDFVLPYADTTIMSCSLVEVEPRGPQLQREEFCKDLGMAYTDEVTQALENSAGVCYTIKRTWEVSDWCESDPYYLPEFVQYIYIKNTEGPEVVNGNVEDICFDQGCEFVFSKTLEVIDDCTPVEELSVIWRIERKLSGAWETVKSGSGLQINSLALASGSYRLTVEAEDQCRNVTRKTSEFKVSYCKALKIEGPESITFNLNKTQDQLRLTDIPYTVTHPCESARYDVLLRYKGEGLIDNDGKVLPPLPGQTSIDVTCDKLGANLIELWVVDEAGNSNHYVLSLEVKDPRGLCPNSDNQLAGSIRTPEQYPISEVSVRLNGPVAEIRRNMTDNSGTFNLGAFPTTSEALRIEPSKEDNPLNGITAFDALSIFRMAMNKSTPTTPYERLAADMNEDGVISVLDVLMIQSLLLNKIDRIPGRQWLFINGDMQPISTIRLNQEYRSMLHFVGVKKGDVNYSASVRSSDRRTTGRENFVLGEPEFHNGFIRVPVSLGGSVQVESMQFSLTNGNSVPWVAIEPGKIPIVSSDYSMDEKDLSVVWIATEERTRPTEQADFYLVFDNVPGEQIDRELIQLSMNLTPEIYSDQKLKENIRLETKVQQGVFEVSNPYPNPFSHSVRIDLSGETGKLQRSEIYNLSGKQVYREKVDQSIRQYTFDGSVLPAAGFYTIRLIMDSGVVNRKLYYLP